MDFIMIVGYIREKTDWQIKTVEKPPNSPIRHERRIGFIGFGTVQFAGVSYSQTRLRYSLGEQPTI